jgi:hypothetical protein
LDEEIDVDLKLIREHLASIPPGTYSMIVIDALYRVLPEGTDENSNSHITKIYNMLSRVARAAKCAVVIVHHASKGSQHLKSTTDLGSGAGAQSRAVDVHLGLRDHADPATVVMEAAMRKLPPLVPTCLKFDFPLFRIAPEASPDNLAVPNRKPGATVAQVVAHVPEKPAPKSEVLDSAWEKLKTSKKTVRKLFDAAVEQGLVTEVPSRGNSPTLVSLSKKVKA